MQRLDGGAMFGVVPRPLWSKRIAPDERHRIPLAMRCLLIEHPDGLVLVDTALGNKETPGSTTSTASRTQGLEGATQLEDALASAGFLPRRRALGDQHPSALRPCRRQHDDRSRPWPTIRAPRAADVSQRDATWCRKASSSSPGTPTSAPARATCRPISSRLRRRGRWRLLEGDGEVLPGISVRLIPGHVPFQQAVLVPDRGETAAFMADLIPTTRHLPLPWIMGYDLEPLRTLETKRAFLRDAVAGSWRLIFEHDPRGVGVQWRGRRVLAAGETCVASRSVDADAERPRRRSTIRDVACSRHYRPSRARLATRRPVRSCPRVERTRLRVQPIGTCRA